MLADEAEDAAFVYEVEAALALDAAAVAELDADVAEDAADVALEAALVA